MKIHSKRIVNGIAGMQGTGTSVLHRFPLSYPPPRAHQACLSSCISLESCYLLIFRVSNPLAECKVCVGVPVGDEERVSRTAVEPMGELTFSQTLLGAEMYSQVVADAKLLEHPKFSSQVEAKGVMQSGSKQLTGC